MTDSPSSEGLFFYECAIVLSVKDIYFDELKKIYNHNGYRLYIVGGTTRDLLLSVPYVDEDFVTDATPEESRLFLEKADYTFAKFGSLKVMVNGRKCDITTLREEGEYNDHRHPSFIAFVKETEKDYLRRDFTINGMYLDENYNLIDYCGGEKDLENKLIRFIGDPIKRIKEDPLRIIRAERFAEKLGFCLEEKTKMAIGECRHLLKELNPDKIKEEERKGWRNEEKSN